MIRQSFLDGIKTTAYCLMTVGILVGGIALLFQSMEVAGLAFLFIVAPGVCIWIAVMQIEGLIRWVRKLRRWWTGQEPSNLESSARQKGAFAWSVEFGNSKSIPPAEPEATDDGDGGGG